VTTYDEKVLQQYADDLYQQAKWIVVMSALRYGLAVFLVSFGISMMAASSQKQVSTDAANSGVILVLFLTVVGIAVGVDAGRRKAFMLKLQAQQILCQRQTELNTRKQLTHLTPRFSIAALLECVLDDVRKVLHALRVWLIGEVRNMLDPLSQLLR